MARTRTFRQSFMSTSVVAILLLALAGTMLPMAPALAADSEVDPFDPEVVQPEPAPAPDVITDAEREVPTLTSPEDEVDWSYEEPSVPDSPQQLVEEGKLLPKEGGPMTDVYAVDTADGDAEHAALVYTDVVNRETTTGKWIDLVMPELVEGTDAFTAKANAMTLTFPKVLRQNSRVIYATQGGELRSVLLGVDEQVPSQADPSDSAPSEGTAPEPTPIEASPAPVSSPTPAGSPSPIAEITSPAEEPSGEGEVQSPSVATAVQTGERSVLYRDVLPSTNAEYIANDQGYKENIILKSPEANPNLAWEIHAEGFTLRQIESGEILIADAEGVDVSGFGLPLIHDSAAAPREIYGAYSLTALNDGNYTLSLAIDSTWLAQAVYPVVVDPGPQSATKYPSRDTTVSSANNNNYENDQQVWISNQSGDKRRAFIKQDLSSLTNHGRIVYSATMLLVPYTVSNCTPYNDIVAKRVQAPNGWPAAPMTWNNQPGVDGAAYNGKNGSDGPNGNSFGQWNLTDIYQHYIDLDQPFHWENQGIRFSEGPTNAQCKVVSSEVGGGARPTLLVSYNDLPGQPSYSSLSLADDVTVNTPSPALKISNAKPDRPNDPNDDDVMFQYQVSKDPDCASSPDNENLCEWGKAPDTGYTSPPTDTYTWTVPSGVLTDGGTFWWRVISVDVCGHNNGIQLCGNKGGDSHTVPYKGTPVRKFHVVLPKLGTDPDWQQWTQAIGNGIAVNVNEATGNLNLDVQLESAGSPLGVLGAGLTYNSQSSDFSGTGTGWDLAIGEESLGNSLPLGLTQNGVNTGSSIEIEFRGGEKKVYSKQDDARVWGAAGSEAGWITAAVNAEAGKPYYTYRLGDGSIFTFAPNGTLLQARPRGTVSSTSDDYYFGYNFVTIPNGTTNPDGTLSDATRLDWVEDPRGKRIDLTWTVATGNDGSAQTVLSSIETWNDDDGSGTNNVYRFNYVGGGWKKLESITTPATANSTGAAILEFGYGATSGKIEEVANATQVLSTGPTALGGQGPNYKTTEPGLTKAWKFELTRLQEKLSATTTITGPYRVTMITPPASPGIAAKPWLFNYTGNGSGTADFFGAIDSESTVAEIAYVCDPNSGYGAYTQCVKTGTALPANGTQLDFNAAGRPIRIAGPTVAQGGDGANSYARMTTMLWDSNNQLLCVRSAEANAYAPIDPLTVDANNPSNPSDCRNNTRNTVYEYQSEAPFNEIKVTYPDPGTLAGPDTGKRMYEETFYEDTTEFQALWVEGFRSEVMRGLPAMEKASHHSDNSATSVTFNETWNGYGPDGIGNPSNDDIDNGDDQNDGFAVQWSGYLDLRGKQDGQKYAFKVPSNQPVALSVGTKTLFDCAGADRSAQDLSINCGRPNDPGEIATVTLTNSLRPISVTYTHEPGTGSAGITLRWDDNYDKDNPNFEILGSNKDDLNTNLGIATKTVEGYQQGSAETTLKTTTYSFDGAGGLSADEAKRRRTASKITVSAGGDTSVTTHNAFDLYGNPIQTTTSGTTAGGTSVLSPTSTVSYHTGTDTPANYGACQTQAKDPIEVASGSGVATDSTCDAAGNVTQTSTHLDAAPGQAAHERIVKTDYDRANRPIRVTTYKDSTSSQPLSDANTTYLRDGRVYKMETLVSRTPVEAWSKTYSFYAFTSSGPITIGVTDSPSGTGWVGAAAQFDWTGNPVFEYKPYPITSDPATLTAAQVIPPSGQIGSCSIYDALGRVTISRTGTTFTGGTGVCAEDGLASRTDYYLRSGSGADFRSVSTDAAGVSTTTWFDMAGRIVKRQTEDRLPATITYDAQGNAVSSVTSLPSNGSVRMTNSYDGFGRVTKVVNFADANDANDTGANEEVSLYQYNSLGQLEGRDGPRANDLIRFTYDLAGKIKTGQYDGVYLPNPDGSTSTTAKVGATFSYDSAGERIGVDIPLVAGGTTMTRSWTYNGLGQQSSFTDGRGRTSTYDYDVAGHLVRTALPQINESATEKNTNYGVVRANYNVAGKMISQYATNAAETSFVGGRECMAYDYLGNLKSTYVMTQGGDACNPGTADATKTVSADYDTLNRVLKVTASGSTTDYAYDPTGRIQTIIDAAGTTAYSYYTDADSEPEGAMKSVDDPLVASGVTTYTYDDAGRPEQRTDPVGLSWSLAYEAATGRLDKETIRNSTNKILAEFDPTFGAGGNVSTMSQTIVKDPSQVTSSMTSAQIPASAKNSDSGTWAYDYDGASRLLTATQAGGPGTNASFTYGYDGGGNRIKAIAPKPDGTQATTLTNFDAAGLATTETRGSLTRTYAYDVAGSLVSKQTTSGSRDAADKDYTYTYDPWGRMTAASLTENGATQGSTYTTGVAYSLDALGRTTQRSSTSTNPGVNAATSTFALRGTTELVAKATTGSSSVSYAYNSAGAVLAQGATGSGSAEFFLKNTHGDVIGSVSTAASGGITGTVAYSPFGERRSGTGGMDPAAEKQSNKMVMGFQGQPTDAATGLVDANTRMYDPSIGRFTTIDSVFGDLANPTSLNQYAYGNANPVTMSDPSGMSAMSRYRAAMREFAAELVAWRAAVVARNFYLNVALPEYRDQMQFWMSQPAFYQQHPGTMPIPPPFVPAPGPKPTPPPMPPVTVVSRERVADLKAEILERAREAAAEAGAKARADAAAALEQRNAIRHDAALAAYKAQGEAEQRAADARALAERPLWQKGLDAFNENLNPGYHYLDACFNTDGTESLASWGAGCATGATSLTLTAVGGAKAFGPGKPATAPCNSFSADTRVRLKNGRSIAIRRVAKGASVAAARPAAASEAVGRRVLGLIRHSDSDWYRLRLQGEVIEVTKAHPFYVRGRGWIEAQNLEAGMQLKTLGGDGVELQGIKRLERTARAYNLTVAGLHTYFVGESELLVHNSACDRGNDIINWRIAQRTLGNPQIATGPMSTGMKWAAGTAAFAMTTTAVVGPFAEAFQGGGSDSGPTIGPSHGGGLTYRPDLCPSNTGCPP